MAEITVTVDGVKYADHVEPRMLLVHYLREVVGKTGTPIGCDTSNCGACTVLLDGQSVKSCSVLAVQADGAEITTIQGLANGGLHPLQRKEDERLLTGQTNWTDNITLPGMLHIAFLRSPYAHARITSVDVSAARNEPGVIAAYSGADFAAEQGSLPCAWPVTPDIVIPAHPPMAVDEVRYVG